MPDERPTVRADPPARNRSEAIDRYRHRLQLSLGLVSQGPWYAGETAWDKQILALTTEPWPLRIVNQDRESIYLFAGQHFSVGVVKEGWLAGQWKVRTHGYAYSLGATEHADDAWLHWHWHPPKRDDPHVHMRTADEEAPTHEGVRGHHIPSGRVSFEAVIRYLIDDCRVLPREGAREVLAENEELFRRFRTWG